MTRRTVLERGAIAGIVASLGLASASGTVAAKKNNAVPITGPTTITAPGYYVLTRDIVGEGSITVEPGVNDVTIDGQRHTLSGDGTETTGIYAGQDPDGPVTENVVVKNIHVTDFTRSGIDFQQVDGGQIKNATFTNCGFWALEWINVVGVTVENCRFSENGGVAFAFDACDDATFARNRITDNGTGLIFSEGSFNLTVENNQFEHNGGCIQLDEVSNYPEIVNNRFYRNLFGVDMRYIYDGHVHRNQFVENENTAISTEEVSGIVIEKNSIRGNGGDGIFLGDFSNENEVLKNRILDNGGDGTELVNADDNVLSKNTIKRNGGVPINVSADSTGNVVEDNRT
ncbi:right-handed parallel beta-helix repeat-containing protein [Haloferax sp. DFSO52]|uniref:right-handed parallel beta-helix repeat-containing protein n=1 Tax=Haloferax sp. DFSO52 TaxID=3388505 RepID=UPI003A85A291